MPKRKSLSKKIRFEVLKRDKFTCQYCGRKAPDVLLEVDHIDPVANGGTNSIFNLVTSCHDCNSGKGARALDDESVVAKQRAQLDLEAERIEQLEMLYEWQKSLAGADAVHMKQVELVHKFIEDLSQIKISDACHAPIREWLKKFGYEATMEACRISFSQYSAFDEAIAKIPGIAYNRTHKTCGQCVNADGRENNYLWWCPLFDKPRRSSFAEECEHYKSMFE